MFKRLPKLANDYRTLMVLPLGWALLFCMLLDMPWSSGTDPSFITYRQHNVETLFFIIFIYYQVIFCDFYLLNSVSQACDFVLLPHFADSLVGGSENTVSDMFIYAPHPGQLCDKRRGCIFSSAFCVTCQLLIIRWLSLPHFQLYLNA